MKKIKKVKNSNDYIINNETNDDISDVIDQILAENTKNVEIHAIKNEISNSFSNSSSIISELRKLLFIIDCSDNYEEAYQCYAKINLKYEEEISHIEYLIISSDSELLKGFSSFEMMKHNFYVISNLLLDCKAQMLVKKTDEAFENINKISKSSEDLKNKSLKIEKQYENIGSTILTIVLSVTVVTTSIAAISRINAIYIPVFIVGLVWLSMTLMVFITDLFKYKESNSKQAVGLYFLITLLLGILLADIYFNYDRYNDFPLCFSEQQEATD